MSNIFFKIFCFCFIISWTVLGMEVNNDNNRVNKSSFYHSAKKVNKKNQSKENSYNKLIKLMSAPYSCQHLSEILGLSEKTIKIYLSRAVKEGKISSKRRDAISQIHSGYSNNDIEKDYGLPNSDCKVDFEYVLKEVAKLVGQKVSRIDIQKQLGLNKKDLNMLINICYKTGRLTAG